MAKVKVQPKKSTFNKRNQLIVISVVAILIVVSLAAFEINNASKPAKKKTTNNNPNGPPETGNWVVDKPVTVEKKDLVLNGNLSVQSGGKLYLLNSTLKVASTNITAIHVASGGELHIIGTALSFEETPTYYILQAAEGSVLEVKTSQIPFKVMINTSGADLEHNAITGKFAGISIGSSSNKIEYNTIKGTDYPTMDAAIIVNNGTKNTISSNVLSGFGIGIELDRSNNNTLYNNSITATTATGSEGAGLQFSQSSDNEVTYNQVSKCSVALNLIGSSSNKFHHNNFIDNIKQVQDDASNKFDDGSSGNFWSDYKGFDLNKDGKGDIPYIINLSDRDNHPFMKPVPAP